MNTHCFISRSLVTVRDAKIKAESRGERQLWVVLLLRSRRFGKCNRCYVRISLDTATRLVVAIQECYNKSGVGTLISLQEQIDR